MKIAMVSRMVEREGGVQRVVWELAKRCAEQGHQVHLYTNSCPELPHPSVVFHKVPMLMSRPFRKSQNPWVKALQVWSFAWFSRLAVSRQKYDIVHVHGDSLAKADIRSAHSCHKAWIKYELSLNSSLGNILRKRVNPLHAIVLLIEYYDYNLKGAQQVISVSKTVKQQVLDEYGIDNSRIVIVPAGVEVAKYAVPKEFNRVEFRQSIGIPNSVPLMVLVGWEFGRKGLVTVLEAMTVITSSQPHLLVIGGDRAQPFMKKAKRLEIADRIHFVGAQSNIFPYLWGSDLFVFPTCYEPFGIVVAEAMATGLPVIVSRCAGSSEWLQDGVDAILLDDPFSAEELALAIDRIISNPEVMVTMGKAAQQKSQIVDWDRVAEKTLDVYSSILNHKEAIIH